MILVKDLNVMYGKKYVYKNTTIEFPDKGINFLMGKNGAGKTTLIKCLLNYMDYKGEITINGKKYESDKKNLFAVFDDSSLYKNLSGLQNIMLITDLSKEEVYEAADVFLSKSILDKKVKTYSYGERKKIFLIIVDILKPRFLVMDEVSNGLDYETMLTLKSKIKLWSKNTTIILTGHQFEFYKDIVDRVFVINKKNISCIEKEENRTLEEIYEETFK